MRSIERRLIAVEGVVQGVGFRPFVYRQALTLDLRGFVRNDGMGVLIDVEGEAGSLADFVHALTAGPPPLASIAAVRTRAAEPIAYREFVIAPSGTGVERTAGVPADAATCDACLRELFDPADRRFRYPFINCTHCGPRLTIIECLPYDRERTTMMGFALCVACRREYEDPLDRRFHAQPLACAACGPRLSLRSAAALGDVIASQDAALLGAAAALRAGRIVAIKGVGGYHLACDATDATAVRRLRERKRREAKPLAVMVADLATAARLCRTSATECSLLASAERPIVLLEKREAIAASREPDDIAASCRAAPAAAARVAEEVAPGNRYLGVMLPYTGLHHLLLGEVGRPLVMTSGNRSDEPIAIADDDAFGRLSPIADLFLTHDRPIATRCDDSVVRVQAGGRSFVRRSRGWSPLPIGLPAPVSLPVLGVGGHQKNTFCLTRAASAFLSHHIGDLESLESVRALADAVTHYGRLFDIAPAVVAHDLHPDYLSTRLAQELPCEKTLAVQHHHAHVAACMAENGVREPVLGVAFDGTGLGTDGAIWGGEFLLVEGAGYERLAHLAYVPLPGGAAAIRRPLRMAAAHLHAVYGKEMNDVPLDLLFEMDPMERELVLGMVSRGVNSPPTSSMGRLFDAVAALLGLGSFSRFEGELALGLETAAGRVTGRRYAFEVREHGAGWVADAGPVIRGVVDDRAGGQGVPGIAAGFHDAVAALVIDIATRVRARTGVRRVALTGGVFQNQRLVEATAAGLCGGGFDVLLHRAVPCNDGGLALGQAWVAALSMDRDGPSELASPKPLVPPLLHWAGSASQLVHGRLQGEAMALSESTPAPVRLEA